MGYKNNLHKLAVFSNNYLKERKQARTSFKHYIIFMKKHTYEMSWFHEVIIDELNDFILNDVKKLMLFAPPQHGKSELSSRLAPSFILGVNPSLKLAIVCYAKTIAEDFSSDVQEIISSQKYGELFPNTKIDGVRGVKRGTLKRNNYIVKTSEGGYLISVGVGGPLTSKSVDIAIIDDLYKSKEDAWSSLYRNKVWNWYFYVLERRLHRNSKILILYTRWHEEDLAGKLLAREQENWRKVVFEILKTGKITDKRDVREVGEALWPTKHTKESAERWKKLDPISFEGLGQQNPKLEKGKMYPRHKVYVELPDFSDYHHIYKAYGDTADEGADYLATGSYIECDGYCYITEILYTQDPMEVTEPLTAALYDRNNVKQALIESNNGGKGFAREVRRHLKTDHSNNDCAVNWFHQSDNKQARIWSNAAKVMNRVIFPDGWKDKYPDAYASFVNFMRVGKNEHDDFQDFLTGIVENIETIPDDDIGVYFDNEMV